MGRFGTRRFTRAQPGLNWVKRKAERAAGSPGEAQGSIKPPEREFIIRNSQRPKVVVLPRGENERVFRPVWKGLRETPSELTVKVEGDSLTVKVSRYYGSLTTKVKLPSGVRVFVTPGGKVNGLGPGKKPWKSWVKVYPFDK